MERTIKLSKLTERKLDNLLEYLEKKWSTTTKNDFIKKLDKVFSQIKANPNIYPKSQIQKEVHKCVITSQTTIYYSFDHNSIYVITLFDNRQDPGKLQKELS
jgi:plasmid stabilization system protein ParE